VEGRQLIQARAPGNGLAIEMAGLRRSRLWPVVFRQSSGLRAQLMRFIQTRRGSRRFRLPCRDSCRHFPKTSARTPTWQRKRPLHRSSGQQPLRTVTWRGEQIDHDVFDRNERRSLELDWQSASD